LDVRRNLERIYRPDGHVLPENMLLARVCVSLRPQPPITAALALMEGTMRRYLQAACLISAMALASNAHADNARTAEAEARFNEGIKLADSGNYDQARLKFLQALEMKKVASVLFNLAGVEMRTGHEVEAVEHYRAFLKLAPADPRITDALTDTAKNNIGELLKKIGQIDIEAPQEAKISIDGRVLEEMPNEPLPVSPGKHTVKGSLNGKTLTINVEPQAGQVAKAKFDFPANDGVPMPSPPGAGGEAERTTVGWVVPIGLGVLGVSGVVMGAAFASASNSSKDDLDRQREASPGLCAPPRGPACAGYEDKVSTVNSQATLAWVGYGVGAAALATSILTFVFLPKSTKSSSPASGTILAPVLGPRVAGANFQLHF
jgi:hypothetical protein